MINLICIHALQAAINISQYLCRHSSCVPPAHGSKNLLPFERFKCCGRGREGKRGGEERSCFIKPMKGTVVGVAVKIISKVLHLIGQFGRLLLFCDTSVRLFVNREQQNRNTFLRVNRAVR